MNVWGQYEVSLPSGSKEYAQIDKYKSAYKELGLGQSKSKQLTSTLQCLLKLFSSLCLKIYWAVIAREKDNKKQKNATDFVKKDLQLLCDEYGQFPGTRSGSNPSKEYKW